MRRLCAILAVALTTASPVGAQLLTQADWVFEGCNAYGCHHLQLWVVGGYGHELDLDGSIGHQWFEPSAITSYSNDQWGWLNYSFWEGWDTFSRGGYTNSIFLSVPRDWTPTNFYVDAAHGPLGGTANDWPWIESSATLTLVRTVTPEPVSVLLMLTGFGGIAAVKRRLKGV